MLPIEAIKSRLLDTLKTTNRAVITADPGSGKSTLLPQFFLGDDQKTLIAQPRRIAARSLATYISTLLNETVGQRVGYRVRHDKRVSNATKLEYVTDGMLVRLIQNDPELSEVGTVILDEFHERSAQLDLALALLLEIQSAYRPGLRILIMSATLDVATITDWFDAPHFHAPGKVFDNTIVHSPRPISQRDLVSEVVRQAIRFSADEAAKNILVFLPGVREINRVHESLRLKTSMHISMLHGQVPLAEQSKVLSNTAKQIILATNVAETSLTIPNVNRVIDTGWRREARYVPSWLSQALFTSRITLFSAQQRAGRANRTENGEVYRLWTEFEHVQLSPQDQPEIRTSNLERLYLECLAWGCRPHALEWLTPPPPKRLHEAEALLTSLGVLDESGLRAEAKTWHLTALSPRANAVVSDIKTASVDDRARVAYLLPLLDGERPPNPQISDIQSRFSQLSDHHSYARSVESICKTLGLRERVPTPTPLLTKTVLHSLLLGFPERLGRRRSAHESVYLMANGTGGRLHGGPDIQASEFLFALSVGGQKSTEMTIFDIVGISESMIPFEETQTTFFSEADQKVVCRQRHGFGAIVLSEQPRPLPDDPEMIAHRLAEAANSSPQKAFSVTDQLRRLCARIAYANVQRAQEKLPVPFDGRDTEHHWSTLVRLCHGHKSFNELMKLNLADEYLQQLTYPQRQLLDQLAPAALKLSNGQLKKLNYSENHGPTLSTRFEWLFGVTNTPCLNGEPIMLELLAPNMRPIQLTKDPESFWKTGYPDVRRDLRGRYPKHPWPDNPLNAKPGVGRRRKQP